MPLRFRRFLLPLLLTGGVGAALPGLRAEDGIRMEPLAVQASSGKFRFGGVEFQAGRFDPGWGSHLQSGLRAEGGFPRSGSGWWETRGALPGEAGAPPVVLQERLAAASDGTLQASFRLEADPAVPTRESFLRADLPVSWAAGRSIVVDGIAVELPAAARTDPLLKLAGGKPHTLAIPAPDGMVTISGTFSALLQDERAWHDDSYSLRFRFAPEEPKLARAALDIVFGFAPYRSVALPLRDRMNRGLRDDVAGDGRGGWTDQGPANDLASLKPGPLSAAGVNFDIVDPAANQGRAALVLAKAGHGDLPAEAAIAASAPQTWRNLYLLHAAAWLPPAGSPVGRLVVQYGDGSESRFDIEAGRDVGNWWSPAALPNGALGWAGENPSSPVGLYVSRFPLDPKPLAGVRFEAEGGAMWMIVGLSGSPDDIPVVSVPLPLTIAAGGDWAPYSHTTDIEPGGVFDFSFLADAPAGKYGRLLATPEGHLQFEDRPGVPVRFWGVNLIGGANFLDKAQADQLAERLSRSGYNCVRLHHFDGILRPSGRPMDAAKLDQLDYLFAALKRQGLYLNIDLYSNRTFGPDDLAAMGLDPKLGLEDTRQPFKLLIPVSDAAFRIWEGYARELLGHRNPYTGLTWAADPALAGICPVNEDTATGWIDRTPLVRPRYDQAFAVWREKAENCDAARGDADGGFVRFVNEAQRAAEARMQGALRALGSRALLTGTNFKESQGLALLRQDDDYVDNHRYWDHPEFPGKDWQLPFRFRQADAVQAVAFVPRVLMPTRILGKPFTVTEFNFTRPNRYRAEGGVLMPAYASLQDWDALYNFEYASDPATFGGGVGGTFSIAGDPIGLLADRVAALLFRRGDIAPAPHAIRYAVQPSDLGAAGDGSADRPFPPAFSPLGLVTRIGSGMAATAFGGPVAATVVDDPSTAAPDHQVYSADAGLAARLRRDGVLPDGAIDDAGKRFVSETGQIDLRASEGTMRVAAPRCELFVLAPGTALEGDRARVRNGAAFATVSVVALDGLSLEESRRILVTHLTDALPTGMRFSSQDQRLLETRGTAPNLVRKGETTLSLSLSGGRNYRVWAVDAAGRRQRELPLEPDGAGFSLKLETVDAAGSQLAYEIVPR